MTGTSRNKCLSAFFSILSLLLITVMITKVCGQPNVETNRDVNAVPPKVMTFYYPWYGNPRGPGGAGSTVHWGRIDEVNKNIEASTHYPALGAYDSHDPNVIDQHCRRAKRANNDTLIVSWWGHGDYSDRALPKILDGCQRHGLAATIYYETIPRPQNPQSAADDITKVLEKYGKHPAFLKVSGKPVVFIYGRTLQEMGLSDWRKAIEIINTNYKGGFVAIGDQFSQDAARTFAGVHTYNTAGSLRNLSPETARKWAVEKYPSWVKLADGAGKICAITVIPGYDDTKIRKPGLSVGRYDGELYRVQWEEAIKADPHWILVTSFNEWHEGSEIEPSTEYKEQYIDLTAKYAKLFKAKDRIIRPRSAAGAFSSEQKAQLRDKFKGIKLGVLPDADSPAFWWLSDAGIGMEVLTWDNVAEGMTPQKYPVLLYCGGEHYRRSVNKTGDVDDAIVGYLKTGGTIAFLPSLPWPFYYDENGKPVPPQAGSRQFGLTLRGGWESPPTDAGLHFIQPQHILPHLPKQFPFPILGDLRWRPFFADNHTKHISLLQLRDGGEKDLGDAVAYAELAGGGRILYTWFSLLDGPYVEALLYDVFDFLAAKLGR
ncbi:MAG: hypothetical protein NTX52_10875 [Planctomycetota bacterium]|nr:hypothetical protein [Planctomycetota bacterium]